MNVIANIPIQDFNQNATKTSLVKFKIQRKVIF